MPEGHRGLVLPRILTGRLLQRRCPTVCPVIVALKDVARRKQRGGAAKRTATVGRGGTAAPDFRRNGVGKAYLKPVASERRGNLRYKG